METFNIGEFTLAQWPGLIWREKTDGVFLPYGFWHGQLQLQIFQNGHVGWKKVEINLYLDSILEAQKALFKILERYIIYNS